MNYASTVYIKQKQLTCLSICHNPQNIFAENQNELRTLKAQLRRVTEERDILKEAVVFFAGESKKNTRS